MPHTIGELEDGFSTIGELEGAFGTIADLEDGTPGRPAEQGDPSRDQGGPSNA